MKNSVRSEEQPKKKNGKSTPAQTQEKTRKQKKASALWGDRGECVLRLFSRCGLVAALQPLTFLFVLICKPRRGNN